jgi:mono/diheme cytochrome c family protein
MGRIGRARTLAMIAAAALVLPASLPARTAADGIEQGRMLFFSQGCYGCHRIGPAGMPVAHDLSHIGRRYTASELARWLREPAAQRPSAHMPRLALTEDEIQSLAAYLATLR